MNNNERLEHLKLRIPAEVAHARLDEVGLSRGDMARVLEIAVEMLARQPEYNFTPTSDVSAPIPVDELKARRAARESAMTAGDMIDGRTPPADVSQIRPATYEGPGYVQEAA